MAFKERFSGGKRANVITVGENGIVRRQTKEKPEQEIVGEIDDVDAFLAELDMNKGMCIRTLLISDPDIPVITSAAGKPTRPPTKGKVEHQTDLDSFVDSLI